VSAEPERKAHRDPNVCEFCEQRMTDGGPDERQRAVLDALIDQVPSMGWSRRFRDLWLTSFIAMLDFTTTIEEDYEGENPADPPSRLRLPNDDMLPELVPQSANIEPRAQPRVVHTTAEIRNNHDNVQVTLAKREPQGTQKGARTPGIEERDQKIIARLREGAWVSDIAKEFGLSKASIYLVRNKAVSDGVLPDPMDARAVEQVIEESRATAGALCGARNPQMPSDYCVRQGTHPGKAHTWEAPAAEPGGRKEQP